MDESKSTFYDPELIPEDTESVEEVSEWFTNFNKKYAGRGSFCISLYLFSSLQKNQDLRITYVQKQFARTRGEYESVILTSPKRSFDIKILPSGSEYACALMFGGDPDSDMVDKDLLDRANALVEKLKKRKVIQHIEDHRFGQRTEEILGRLSPDEQKDVADTIVEVKKKHLE